MKKIISVLVVTLLIISSFSLMVLGDGENDDNVYIPSSTTIKIENQNKYNGMNNSFSDGYVPTIENDTAKIILPLTVNGKLKDDTITAKAEIDFSNDSPFVCKNYEKTVKLNKSNIYLVCFDLALTQTRKNGNYPVTISVRATEENGGIQFFSTAIYVCVTDQKSAVNESNIKMQFDDISIPEEVTVSDVIEVPFKVLNLSKTKVCNVRANVKADGLICKSTAFIGDIEAGTQAESSFEITVTSLSGNKDYGTTNGIVTYVYEDENGQEFTKETQFTTNIKSPFTKTDKSEQKNPNQWWWIMLVIVAIIVIAGLVYLFLYSKKRRKNNDG